MAQELIDTGIDIIGEAPWGTHFCQFYQTKEDLADVLVPYFRAGLENNEFCMWITAEPLEETEIEQLMRRAMPDFDSYLRKGQIEILPHTQWYLEDGYFDSQRVLNGWVEKLDQALARGFKGLRLTGNTFWLEKDDWRAFTDYEEEINKVINRYRIMALCTYSLDKCLASEIIDVVINHQFALIKREGVWELIESSERKRAAEQIQVLNRELEARVRELTAANQDLEAFSYSVSHDLRAPLRAIAGFAKILDEEYAHELGTEARRYLQTIVNSAKNMGQLIDDLLSFSRLGRQEIILTDLNLAEIAHAEFTRLKTLYPGRSWEFHVEPLPSVKGDLAMISRVLANLLDNAMKFTRGRNPAVIEIKGRRAGGETVFSVEDNGIGFDMQYYNRLFGAFQRLHSEAEYPGTGVGLAIVQRVIQRHGGRVWAEGRENAGAKFFFTLPG